MTTHRILTLVAVMAAFAAPAMAEVVWLSPKSMDDGPWIAVPEGISYSATAPTYDDIVALANLDDDPTVITDEELEMIAVLSQVLGSSPITN